MAKTRPVKDASTTRVRRVRVAVTSGPDKGLTVDLGDGPLSIGTDPHSALPLTDDTVSEHHAELSLEQGAVVIRDLGSTNGVFLGGLRIIAAHAEPPTKLKLGETLLSLKALDDEQVNLWAGDAFGPLYGISVPMRALFWQLNAIAASDAPVLIEGETGTGKEVTAEAIHHASPRSGGPFVVFDCAATSASLLESELFGHERGAFTGAAGARVGLAEAADGGTLVIDEVGELPLELQPKLLRFLERREVRRIGANQPTAVDVRIVACTNRSLRTEVKAGRFREDLYFRLSALKARVPALRERPDDIPGLVDRMLERRAAKRRFDDLPEADRALLLAHRWPGNVRELRNVVDRLVVYPAASPQLEEDGAHAPPAPAPDGPIVPLSEARERAHDEFERRYLAQAMARADGSISEAARLAGVSRQFLQRLLRKYAMR